MFNYITEDTFDGYLWQILEQKQRYISQIMQGDTTIRNCEDLDETVLQYAEFKALAISDPRIKEKMEVDNELSRITILRSSYHSELSTMKKQIEKDFPTKIASAERRIEQITKDIATIEKNKSTEFEMIVEERDYTERARAAEHIQVIRRKLPFLLGSTKHLGSYAGMELSLMRTFGDEVSLVIKGAKQYETTLGDSDLGVITRMENTIEKISTMLPQTEEELENLKRELESLKVEVTKPFPSEDRFNELTERKMQLDLALEFSQGNDFVSGDRIEKVLYTKLEPLMKRILDNEVDHIRYTSSGFEDFVIEKIGGNEYSVAHYYEQNGDMMRDPEITFYIEDESIYPTSFLQDNMNEYYHTEDVSAEKVADLKEFMSSWFDNVHEQGYEEEQTKEIEQEDIER